MPGIIDAIYDFVFGKAKSAIDDYKTPTTESLIRDLNEARVTERSIDVMFESVRDKRGITGWLFHVLSSLAALNAFIQSTFPVAFRRYVQRLNAAYRNEIPSAETTLNLVSRKFIDENIAREWLLWQGYDPGIQTVLRPLYKTWLSATDIVRLVRAGRLSRADGELYLRHLGYDEPDIPRVFDSAISFLAPGDIIDAWRRGLVSDLRAKMRELGIRDEDTAILAKVTEFVPSTTDLLRLALKDVFEPRIVQNFRLDEDFDEAWPNIRPWAEAIGLREDVARLYWRAQWELPSTSQGFEMFHRGIITRDELELLFKTHDILPFFREKLLQLSYNPLTRVDVRRMYALGVLSEEQVTRAYMELGYSPENARNLTEFVKRETERSLETKQGRARDLSQSMILTLYEERLITREQAKQHLLTLRFDEDEAELLLAHRDTAMRAEVVREARQAVEQLYVVGFMDRETAAAELENAGYQRDVIDELLRIWDYRRAYTARREFLREQKDLTKSELIEAYTDKIIDRTTLINSLKALGYDQNEAQTLAQLADYRQLRATRQRNISALRTLFVNRRLADNEVIRRLDALGLSATEREALIVQWMIEREEATARKEAQQQHLSKEEIRQALRNGIMTPEQAAARLRREGYADDEINILFRLWAVRTERTTRR
jgi:hypothetical protein